MAPQFISLKSSYVHQKTELCVINSHDDRKLNFNRTQVQVKPKNSEKQAKQYCDGKGNKFPRD